MKIFKYPISRVGLNLMTLPQGAKILHFGVQLDALHFWVLVNPKFEHTSEDRAFFIYPTGESMKTAEHERGEGYIGTTIERDGHVWHAFELPREA